MKIETTIGDFAFNYPQRMFNYYQTKQHNGQS